MNREEELKDFVDKAKDIIAKNNDFRDDIIGTSWEYAMGITHRTKRQISLYEYTLTFMADVIFDLKEKVFALQKGGEQ